MDKSLAKLENASRMLAEGRDAGDAHRLMAKASAAEHYARKAKLGEDAISYAHSIKISAEVLLGGFLKTGERRKRGQKHSTGGGSKGSQRVPLPDAPPTLEELGVTKKLSAEAQALHTIAEEQPEQVEAIKERKKSVTQVRREAKRASVSEAAALPSEKYRLTSLPYWYRGLS